MSCDGGGAAAAELSVATTTVKMRRDGHGNVLVGGDGGGSGGGGEMVCGSIKQMFDSGFGLSKSELSLDWVEAAAALLLSLLEVV
ncbi:Hypothetical predicted protein [Prunus dulcis]|uniref:Uncharacterized protein n=1 Tax=Prunus dulcis TaxID=3755 RepID=A0A5E4GBE5_PRUDU|nr:Hypothetical predicted protein [Prunus dulcis]